MTQEIRLKVELKADNENIEMNEFVQKITGNLLWAILKSLRLDHDPKSVTFKLDIN